MSSPASTHKRHQRRTYVRHDEEARHRALVDVRLLRGIEKQEGGGDEDEQEPVIRAQQSQLSRRGKAIRMRPSELYRPRPAVLHTAPIDMAGMKTYRTSRTHTVGLAFSEDGVSVSVTPRVNICKAPLKVKMSQFAFYLPGGKNFKMRPRLSAAFVFVFVHRPPGEKNALWKGWIISKIRAITPPAIAGFIHAFAASCLAQCPQHLPRRALLRLIDMACGAAPDLVSTCPRIVRSSSPSAVVVTRWIRDIIQKADMLVVLDRRKAERVGRRSWAEDTG